MSAGQNTQNISLALGIVSQLLVNAAQLTGAIKTAQDAGVDLTDDQVNSFVVSDNAARDQLQADIDAARLAAGTAPAGN